MAKSERLPLEALLIRPRAASPSPSGKNGVDHGPPMCDESSDISCFREMAEKTYEKVSNPVMSFGSKIEYGLPQRRPCVYIRYKADRRDCLQQPLAELIHR